MRELGLRKTWFEISEHWHHSRNPLRVIEIVNGLGPRSWTFKVTFDGASNILAIDCDSTNGLGEAVELIDGSVEEFLFTKEILIKRGNGAYVGNLEHCVDSPAPGNRLCLDESDHDVEPLLTLNGYWYSSFLPRELQDRELVTDFVLENTWFGAVGPLGKADCTITWKILAEEFVIRPQSRYTNRLRGRSYAATENLYGPDGKHIGQAVLHTGELVEDDQVYTRFGPLDSAWQPSRRRRSFPHYWLVELQSSELERAFMDRGPTARLVDSMRAPLLDTVESAMAGEDFRCYEDAISEDKQREGAKRLRERQIRAQTADRVCYESKPVMLVPSNENEVIALVCKLESLGALPFYDFTLLEYTARVGIDALASFQMTETEVPTQYGSVELEFNYENFFDHGHPERHVNLVICWGFRDDEPPAPLRPREDLGAGFFEYRSSEWSFIVLVLSEISSIEVRRQTDG